MNVHVLKDGDFSSLLADLVKAKKASEPRYAIYSANVRATSDTKLVFFTWTPLSASVTLKKVYKEETDDVIEALGADIWVQVHTGSENDLNLDSVVESGLAGYNIIESSEYVYDLQDNVGGGLLGGLLGGSQQGGGLLGGVLGGQDGGGLLGGVLGGEGGGLLGGVLGGEGGGLLTGILGGQSSGQRKASGFLG